METIEKGVLIFNYTDKAGNSTTRTAIVVEPPSSTMLTIDVSDLSDSEIIETAKLWSEYQEYLELKKKTTLSFETFVEHTTNKKLDVKWRRFTADNVEPLANIEQVVDQA